MPEDTIEARESSAARSSRSRIGFALSVVAVYAALAVDLADNPALEFGRSKYLAPLILALIPFGVLQACFRGSGNMTFVARSPTDASRPE